MLWTVGGLLIGQIAALVRTVASPRPWFPYVRALVEFLLGALALAVLAGPGPFAESLTATAVVAGRQWAPIGRSRTAKGLMIGAGAVTMITPLALPLWAFLWALGFVVSGYRAAGTVVATALLPFAIGISAGWPFAFIIAPAWLLVLLRLAPEARRVLLGVEPKYHWRADA